MNKIMLAAIFAAILIAGCISQGAQPQTLPAQPSGSAVVSTADIESDMQAIQDDLSGMSSDSSELSTPNVDLSLPE